jgi:hypothetical protein
METAATSQETGQATASVPSASKRLVSLDAFRGWTMFWIVARSAGRV